MANIVNHVLVGPNFTLSPFKDEYISESYIGWLNDPDVNRFLEVRFVYQTEDTVRDYVRDFAWSTNKYMWGVFPNGTDHLIGTATLQSVNMVHGTGETAYMVGDREFWGKSAAIEAQSLVMQFAFDSLGLRRLTGGTYARHHAANFNLKRLGFTCEARLRKQYYVAPGEYADGFRWGILVGEWREKWESE